MERSELQNEVNNVSNGIKEGSEEKKTETLHFIEDLENRRNASGVFTTMAIGEEGGSGWW